MPSFRNHSVAFNFRFFVCWPLIIGPSRIICHSINSYLSQNRALRNSITIQISGVRSAGYRAVRNSTRQSRTTNHVKPASSPESTVEISAITRCARRDVLLEVQARKSRCGTSTQADGRRPIRGTGDPSWAKATVVLPRHLSYNILLWYHMK